MCQLFERELDQGTATHLLIPFIQFVDSRQQSLRVRRSDMVPERPANRGRGYRSGQLSEFTTSHFTVDFPRMRTECRARLDRELSATRYRITRGRGLRIEPGTLLIVQLAQHGVECFGGTTPHRLVPCRPMPFLDGREHVSGAFGEFLLGFAEVFDLPSPADSVGP